MSYFQELLASNQEIHENIRPLLRLSRKTIVRSQKTEYAVVSSLQRDPLLAERIKRLRTVHAVGPITTLTWALEIGDVSRFRFESDFNPIQAATTERCQVATGWRIG